MPFARIVKGFIEKHDRRIEKRAVENYKKSLEVPAVPRAINEKTSTFTDERQLEKTDLTNG